MGQHRGSEGRRRLRLLLAGLGLSGCVVAMFLFLVFYGFPYNQIWWGVMAVVLAGAALLPPLLAPAVEWVMDGYRRMPPP
jgi:hypothetical protein